MITDSRMWAFLKLSFWSWKHSQLYLEKLSFFSPASLSVCLLDFPYVVYNNFSLRLKITDFCFNSRNVVCCNVLQHDTFQVSKWECVVWLCLCMWDCRSGANSPGTAVRSPLPFILVGVCAPARVQDLCVCHCDLNSGGFCLHGSHELREALFLSSLGSVFRHPHIL